MPSGPAWARSGRRGAALLGIVLFKESIDLWRLLSIGLVVVVGIVGLKLSHMD